MKWRNKSEFKNMAYGYYVIRFKWDAETTWNKEVVHTSAFPNHLHYKEWEWLDESPNVSGWSDELGKVISPERAQYLLNLRDALTNSDEAEAWHWLAKFYNPPLDKYSDELWIDIEALAATEDHEKYVPESKPTPSTIQQEGEVKPKIYIASKTKHAELWKEWRDKEGKNIISTWIDEAGPGDSPDLKDLAERCIKESSECDAMIVFKGLDEEILKGAFIEFGVALAAKKHIYLVGDVLPKGSAFTNCENVFCVNYISDAFNKIEHTKLQPPSHIKGEEEKDSNKKLLQEKYKAGYADGWEDARDHFGIGDDIKEDIPNRP